MGTSFSKTETITVLAQCGSCGGTGLYRGFAEQEGYPVVCLTCRGTGAQKISYKPYTGRKGKRGVKGVKINPTGLFFDGGSTTKKSMTYDEFKEKFPEPKIDD